LLPNVYLCNIISNYNRTTTYRIFSRKHQFWKCYSPCSIYRR